MPVSQRNRGCCVLDSKCLRALCDDNEDYFDRRNPESSSANETAREAHECKMPNLFRVIQRRTLACRGSRAARVEMVPDLGS